MQKGNRESAYEGRRARHTARGQVSKRRPAAEAIALQALSVEVAWNATNPVP